MPDTLHRKIF